MDSENHKIYMEEHGTHLISTIMAGVKLTPLVIRAAESTTVNHVMVTVRISFHMKILILIQ